MLFDAHTHCLTGPRWRGGRGIYDNMKTAVDRAPARIRPRRQRALCSDAAHYLFEPDFCNVAAGWEKGRVEKERAGRPPPIWQDAAAANALRLCRAQRLAGDAVPARPGTRPTRTCPA